MKTYVRSGLCCVIGESYKYYKNRLVEFVRNTISMKNIALLVRVCTMRWIHLRTAAINFLNNLLVINFNINKTIAGGYGQMYTHIPREGIYF